MARRLDEEEKRKAAVEAAVAAQAANLAHEAWARTWAGPQSEAPLGAQAVAQAPTLPPSLGSTSSKDATGASVLTAQPLRRARTPLHLPCTQRGPPPGESPPPLGKEMGTVKNFNMEKGFGFVIPDRGGAEIFAHALCALSPKP